MIISLSSCNHVLLRLTNLHTQAAFIPAENKYLIIIIIKRHVKPIDTCERGLLLFIGRTFWRTPLHSQSHREVVQNHDCYHRGLLPDPKHKILVLHPYFWTRKTYVCCNFQPHKYVASGHMLWSVYDDALLIELNILYDMKHFLRH